MMLSLEGLLSPNNIDVEDAGRSMIFQLEHMPEEPDGFFVRLQSWDDAKKHETFSQLVGKRVRVTVEVLD